MPQTELILVAKRLQQSELGLFDAHRKAGNTRSRQRGLNLDRNVVDLLLTPQQKALGVARVDVTYRTPAGRVVREFEPRPIKHQAKNWRLTGNRLLEPEFVLLSPGDYVLQLYHVDTGVRLWWEALRASESEPPREAMVAYLTEAVGQKTTVLDGQSKDIILVQWSAVSPDLFMTVPSFAPSRYVQSTFL